MANVYTRQCKFGRTVYLNEFIAYHDPAENPFNERLVKQEIAEPPEALEVYERPWSLKRKAELNVDHLSILMCHEMPEPCYSYDSTMRNSYRNPNQMERIMTHIRQKEAAVGISQDVFIEVKPLIDVPGLAPEDYCKMEFTKPPPLPEKKKGDCDDDEPIQCPEPCDCCYPRRQDPCGPQKT